MQKTEKKTENLGNLIADMGDIANNGLVYYLRGEDKSPLMPLVFCKDYFQDFAYCNVTKDDSKGKIYGYEAKLYSEFDKVETLNLLLFPFSKMNRTKEEFLSNKTLIFKELLKKEEVINSFKKQLAIFEEKLVELQFIKKQTNVELINIDFTTNNKSLIFENENCISLNVDKTYFYNPELLSLYLLLIRNFFTLEIFKDHFNSLEESLKKLVDLKNNDFLYWGDQMILNSANFQLKLPEYLKNKLVKQTWDKYKDKSIGTIHNNSGIYSYLNSKNNG